LFKLTSRAASSSSLQINISISWVALLQLKLGLAANAGVLNKAKLLINTIIDLYISLSLVFKLKVFLVTSIVFSSDADNVGHR
jgi:hypothetical protein